MIENDQIRDELIDSIIEHDPSLSWAADLSDDVQKRALSLFM